MANLTANELLCLMAILAIGMSVVAILAYRAGKRDGRIEGWHEKYEQWKSEER